MGWMEAGMMGRRGLGAVGVIAVGTLWACAGAPRGPDGSRGAMASATGSLDAPAVRYVPEIAKLRGMSETAPMTVRQLLTMTSGLAWDDAWGR